MEFCRVKFDCALFDDIGIHLYKFVLCTWYTTSCVVTHVYSLCSWQSATQVGITDWFESER